MGIVYKNNAKTTLAANVSNSATSLSVADGSVFPDPGAGEFFLVTLDDGSNNEIVKCTARSSNTLTVVRAQESTTARAFSTGDAAEGRVTAGFVTSIQENIAAKSANQTVYNATAASSATDYDIGVDPGVEANAMVFLDGVMQHHDTFSFSGSTLTFDAVPTNGTKIEVIVDNLINLQSSNLTVDTFTATSGQTSFQLSDSPGGESNVIAFIDGVFQNQSSYSLDATTQPSSLVFDTGVVVGRTVTVYTINPVNIGTPSDGTVSSAKLTGNITLPGSLTVGSNNVVFDSTTFVVDHSNSRVGLGTASPSVPVDIVGEVKTSSHINIGGNLVKASGDLTLDVAGDIILDADGGDFKFEDGGSEFLRVQRDGSGNAVFQSIGQNKSVYFSGDDAGTGINALILDMQNAGAATFNSTISSGAITSSGTVTGTQLTAATGSTTAAVLKLEDSGVATYDFSFPDTGTMLLGVNDQSGTTSNKVLKLHNAGSGTLGLNVEGNSSFSNDVTIGGDLTVDTNVLHVNSTNNNVGIGDASPPSAVKLAVQADGVAIRLDGSANTSRQIMFRNTSSSNPAQLKADGSWNIFTEDAGTVIKLFTDNDSSKGFEIDGGAATLTNSSHSVMTLQAGTNSSASLRLKNDAVDFDVNVQTNDNWALYNHTYGKQPITVSPQGYMTLQHENNDFGLQIRTNGTSRSGLVIDKPNTSTIMASALVLASDETYRLGTASHYHVLMYQNGATRLYGDDYAVMLGVDSTGMFVTGGRMRNPTTNGTWEVRTGGRNGTGTYTLFTNGNTNTQSAGIVEVWGIYGTPSGASYTKYVISGNRSIATVISETETNSVPTATVSWNGADLEVTNSNSSLYYHVRVELHDIGNGWNPTWGDFPDIS